ERQTHEDPDAVLQRGEGLAERRALRKLAAFNRCGIGHTPMGRHRLPGPHRTGFARGVVANGEHEIHVRRASRSKYCPALGMHVRGWKAQPAEQVERIGMHLPLGLAPGTEAPEAACSQMSDDRFRQDAAGGVAGAQKQDVVASLGHAAKKARTLWTVKHYFETSRNTV